MKFDLTKSEIKELVSKYLYKINNLNFIIIPTLKNRVFMLDYMLDKAKARDLILNKLSVDNYRSYEIDKDFDKYGVGYVSIFICDCKLPDNRNKMRNIKVYIKIKDVDGEIPVLSMHESEGDK